MPEDEIWDEHRWEAFLRESDERVDRYMDLLFNFLADHPVPEENAPSRKQWEANLREYLQNKGFQVEDPALSSLFSGEDDQIEQEEGMNLFPFEGNFPEEEGAFEEALDSFRNLPAYQGAFELATVILDWANALPGHIKDGTLVQFCTCITQVPANIAKGHGIGYDREMMGGNIACTKRGLNAANEALHLLQEMKQASYMPDNTYRQFYEQTYEVRNGLGLYIQELRHRFDLGVD